MQMLQKNINKMSLSWEKGHALMECCPRWGSAGDILIWSNLHG